MKADDVVDLSKPCAHVTAETRRHVERPTAGCEECLKIGSTRVQLRVCLSCGHVGCCDSSPHKHATAHWQSTKHPVMSSGEPGDTWTWCYEDNRMLSGK